MLMYIAHAILRTRTQPPHNVAATKHSSYGTTELMLIPFTS